MDEAARSAWCREQGLFPVELEAWKRDAVAGLGEPRATSAVEARQDRRRVKELERELHRKDKALAETAALLVLRAGAQKKTGCGLPRRRGRMTRPEDRQTLAAEISEACAAGARLAPACRLAGIDLRTFQRWRTGEDGQVRADRRPEAVRPAPQHALSEAERARMVALANAPRFASTPPARIVPALADEGVYVASEASFHRVLRDQGQMQPRGRARPPRTVGPPSTHVATAPGQVWCWDVTFLRARVQGRWFYLYLILDLWSRKVVGYEVHETDQAEHAAHLARRTALAEGIHARTCRPVLHGDNGPSMKGTTVLAMLYWLGIAPSHSRPRVSDDNSFAEALFRTAKYRPDFPAAGFADLAKARQWAAAFVAWYNRSSQRTSLYVTPAQHHAGGD